jgi:hypothetical protein
MLFEDGENVVVQKSALGRYMIVVPSEKLEALTVQLDNADIAYETEEDNFDVDDVNEEENAASVLTFGSHVDVHKLQHILDRMD